MAEDLIKKPQIQISVFNPFQNKEGIYVPGVIAKDADLYTELYRFKEGYYSTIVEGLRKLTDKDEKSKYKLENLPSFTFSCHFKEKDYRKQANIESYTNILCIDIDYVGVADYIGERKEKDPNYSLSMLRDEIFATLPCVFSGLSCSGNGIFFLVRYEQDQHLDCFLDIELYMKTKYGVTIDAACKDFGRLRFATYDTHCKIEQWEKTQVWQLRPEYLERKRKIEEYRKQDQQKVFVKHSMDAPGRLIDKAVGIINSAQSGERHNKIRSAARLLGGYVATGLLDEEYIKDSLMQATINIGYDDPADAKRAIEFGITTGKQNPLEIDIITPDDPQFDFFIEQDEKRQREIKMLYSELHASNRNGVPLHILDYEDLGARFYIDVDRIKKIADRIYNKFQYMFGIKNKPTIAQVEAYLTSRYELRRDIICDTIQVKQVGASNWYTVKFEDIWRDLAGKGYKFKFDELSRLLHSNFVPEINIWQDHFTKIKMREEDYDYIEEISTYVRCKDPQEQAFFSIMLKKMLVRCIKCALDDNYANRTVFVLASRAQSNGKSSFIRWLNPFGPHQFYAENPLEDNKDARIRLAETFIYNLEELSTSTKTEINRLKAIISQIGSRDRKPYGRQAENMVRRCSFYGSTNNINFLTDDSNTRWICFEIERINWNYTSLDRDSIWAQAYKLYKSGYNCELSEDEASMRDVKNEKFAVVTTEHELMMRYFQPAVAGDPGSIFLTGTSIQEQLLALTKESRIGISTIWVGRALTRLGYERVRENRKWGYWVHPINRQPYSSTPPADSELRDFVDGGDVSIDEIPF